MYDVALSSAGASVVLATSQDDRFPAENIIDGTTESFWASTGMYPQQFIVTFTSVCNINSVKIYCYNVRKLTLEKSCASMPIDFEPVQTKELEQTESALQVEEFNIANGTATHVRLIIESAYDHFVSVHKLHVDGTTQ